MRIISLMASGALVASLAACGSAGSSAEETDSAMMDGGDSSAVQPAAMGTMASDAMTSAGPVTVTIEGVKPGPGKLWIALQGPDDFLKAAGAYKTKVDATGETVTATMEGVAPGTYVAAVIQDENNDGKVELGSKGPTEAWGLSGEKQKGKPEWMPAMFEVTPQGGSTTVMLKYK